MAAFAEFGRGIFDDTPPKWCVGATAAPSCPAAASDGFFNIKGDSVLNTKGDTNVTPGGWMGCFCLFGMADLLPPPLLLLLPILPLPIPLLRRLRNGFLARPSSSLVSAAPAPPHFAPPTPPPAAAATVASSLSITGRIIGPPAPSVAAALAATLWLGAGCDAGSLTAIRPWPAGKKRQKEGRAMFAG